MKLANILAQFESLQKSKSFLRITFYTLKNTHANRLTTI